MKKNLSHVNQKGEIFMVDVGAKSPTLRTATSCGYIKVSSETIEKIKDNNLKKGDVLSTAKIAGIFGAKKTAEIIPLCHTLILDKVDIEIQLDENNNKVIVTTTVKTFGKTGVEMEALTATSCALLTIYDMIKAVDKNAVIGGIKLLEKTGGKSGHFVRNNEN